MPLAQDKAVLAASALALLLSDFPGTISQIAHDEAHPEPAVHPGIHPGHAVTEAEKLGHHGMHQMHVKTPQGVKFYHLPIGSLIIKHEHPGAPLQEGHKLVSSGEHHFSVPQGADVHVPKDTDLSNEAEVKHAIKHVVLHGPSGEHRHADLASGKLAELPKFAPEGVFHKGLHSQLEKDYKKLPGSEAKQPVSFGGKPAAWVPQDWKIYKSAAKPDHELNAKWAMDPDGKWHLIYAHGSVESAGAPGSTSAEQYVKGGKLVPDEPHAPHPEHLEPSKPGAAKVEVGGIAVTKDEIHHAIEVLTKDKSTAVKQPLKAAGHPLAGMDYHGVSTAELKAHPELKVSKGSKQAHVGQVKLAVLHHLAEKAKSFPQTQAEDHVAEHTQEHVQAAASHAQELTPAHADIGGVQASKDDIIGAIAALQATPSTAIKQILKGKHNPLWQVDYWAAIKAHQAEHPNTTAAMKAKETFTDYLKHAAAKLGVADQETGHDDAAELHELVTKGVSSPSAVPGFSDKLGEALQAAAKNGQHWYVAKGAVSGEWQFGPGKPAGTEFYFEATPQHKLIAHGPGTKTEYDDAKTLGIAKQSLSLTAKPKPEPAVKEAEKQVASVTPYKFPPVTKVPGPAAEELHKLISSPMLSYSGPENSPGKPMAVALQMASPGHGGSSWYVIKDGAKWKMSSAVPPAGTFGAPGDVYYKVDPDHSVTGYTSLGHEIQLDPEDVLKIVKSHFSGEPAAEAEAKAPEVKAPEVKAPEVKEPGNPVSVYGNEHPAGSKVYYKPDLPAGSKSRWVQHPDGTWWSGGADGYGSNEMHPVVPGVYDKMVASGTFKEVSPGDQSLIAGVPGVLHNAPLKDVLQKAKEVEDAKQVTEAEAEAPKPQLSPSDQLQADVKNAVLDPAKDDGSLGRALVESVQYATQGHNSGYKDTVKYVTKSEDGKWLASSYSYNVPKGEHYKVTIPAKYFQPEGTYKYQLKDKPEDIKVTHVLADGTQEQMPLQALTDAAGKYAVPDAVLINGTIHKFGHYYSAKGKAHLEITAPSGGYGYNADWKYGTAARANYIYHSPAGATKAITPTAASSHLEKMTEYHGQPKPVVPSAVKTVSYASVPKTGTYKLWSDVEHAPSGLSTLELKADGSSVLATPGATVSLKEGAEDPLLKSGSVLDSYGTTVVKPGIQPSVYHLFGAEAKSKEDLQAALDDMGKKHDDKYGLAEAIKALVPSIASPGQVHDNAMSFFNEKIGGKLNWMGQRDSLTGLLRELLQVPEAQPGELAGGEAKEPVYLKALPPGIHGPKDVFHWTDQGYAQPYGAGVASFHPGSLVLKPLSVLTAPELQDKIKGISAEFGGGQIVGTHPSALSKDKKIAWLDAWRKGDMAAVFQLDSAGGKVSPAHPGAPANSVTHKVTWAPWGAGQVPASQLVPGQWSDHSKVTLPKAEIANYVIKTGLQNSEKLTPAELRQWVISHRGHDQETVDLLSKQAADRFADNHPDQSETPHWSEDLQPAKSYDIFLEDHTAAGDWNSHALSDFMADHPQELEPHIQAVAQETGYEPEYIKTDGSFSLRRQVIQKYLDELKAREIAEKSKPVWSQTPGAITVQSSHPILQLTRTIPLTGDKSQWFFKPGKAYLAEQEDAAGKLGNIWGFRTPSSELLEHDGQFGQAQRKLDAEGDLAYGADLGFYTPAPVPWQELTQRQVSDIAREHLLDWALDNDDGRASNFLRMPDGSVVGIDKGRAWADFGHWNGLAGDEGADERSAQVVTGLYDAIRNHQVSKDVADQAHIAVMQRAARMQRLSDDRMREVLEQAFAHRSKWGSPGSKEVLIQAVTDRKNKLAGDFGHLWAKVYADAGWTLPEVPEQKLPTGHGGVTLHSGFSEPDFAEHVAASKSFGVPAFFGGTELEDGHVLVWHEHSGQGESPVLRGESAARGGAYDKLVAWSKANQTTGPANSGGYGTQFADVGGIKGEKDAYDQIIGAAKTISSHSSDKQFNQSKLDGLTTAESMLMARLGQAEQAQAAGPGSSEWAHFSQQYGSPEASISMAKYYLDHVAKVHQGKDQGTSFHAGDLPRWKPEKPVKEEKPQPGVKVELRSASRSLGSFDDGGDLHTGLDSYSYPGKAWHVKLPTGEEIEFHNSDQHGTEKAHAGRIRFSANAGEGAASLERVRAQLQAMGLDMREAEEPDLELFYWRHLANVLADRKDSQSGKYAKVWDELKSQMTSRKLEWNSSDLPGNVHALADSSLTPEEELGIWHAAWGHVTSSEQVQQFAEKGGHLPHLGHFDVRQPEAVGGKPVWYRFDADPAKLAASAMPGRSYTGNGSILKVAKTGGVFSTEARLRALGIWVAGMSSSQDMGHGSSGTVFTRLNQETKMGQLFNPRVLARTTTYGFSDDNYGETSARKTSSPFSLEKAMAFSGSSNETMVKDAISLLDDMELIRAGSPEARNEFIAWLKDAGISEIRGLPVEDRVVNKIGAAELAKVRALMSQPGYVSW